MFQRHYQNPENENKLLREFIKTYNNQAKAENALHSPYTRVLSDLIRTLMGDDSLYNFIEVLKDTEKLPFYIRSEVCGILQETVNQYYSDSQLIRIDSDNQRLMMSPTKD